MMKIEQAANGPVFRRMPADIPAFRCHLIV
jgi:hypothetical protein